MNSYAGRVVKRWEEVLEPKGFDALLVSAHLNRISALHQEVIEGLAKPYGLSKMDAVLMFLLRGYEAEPIHLSDISKLYRYTPGAITHRIKRLRKMNFVVTVQSQRDSRVPSDSGRRSGRVGLGGISSGGASGVVGRFG